MDRLAGWILGGRFNAALAALLPFAALYHLPTLGGPAILLAGALALVAASPAAAVAMHGGGRAVGEATVVAALGALVITLEPWAPVGWLAGLWLPVALTGLALRPAPRFGTVVAVQTGVLIGLIAAMVVWLGGDPEAALRESLMERVRAMVGEVELPPGERERILARASSETIPTLASVLPGVEAAGLLLTWWLNTVVGLRLALGRDPDLGAQLRAFRLPSAAIWAFIGLGLAAFLARGPVAYWAANALMPLGLIFLAQGLAVAHSARLAFGVGRGWIIGLYMGLGLVPQLVGLALAVIGLADYWTEFRDRLTQDHSS